MRQWQAVGGEGGRRRRSLTVVVARVRPAYCFAKCQTSVRTNFRPVGSSGRARRSKNFSISLQRRRNDNTNTRARRLIVIAGNHVNAVLAQSTHSRRCVASRTPYFFAALFINHTNYAIRPASTAAPLPPLRTLGISFGSDKQLYCKAR